MDRKYRYAVRTAKLIPLVTLLAFLSGANFASITMAESSGTLTTRWSSKVTPDNVLPDYPRPQLKRAEWWNLNGKWQYAICSEKEAQPEKYDGHILVPFPVESVLSGVERKVRHDQRLWYRRSFDAAKLTDGRRLLLHFGAVDWHTTVWVNGQRIDEHFGGYDPFTFDITDAIEADKNEIVVSVWDPTDAGIQPRGKQIRRPHGIWYTSVTGIWQTVWLERVPKNYVESLRLTPDTNNSTIELAVNLKAPTDELLNVTIRDEGTTILSQKVNAHSPTKLKIPDAKLWSPDQPHLYDVIIETSGGDKVESYFGLRSIEVGKDDNGVNRILLNGKPLFQFGLLDQGWWPDGLYTAPTDEALRYDLEVTKGLGFNMVRKHVKVEPARWYYWCDKLGLLVWQDMPSGDKYIGGDEPDIFRTNESANNFMRELKAMVNTHHNHPSIVMWVLYNEGWGQWDTKNVTQLLKQWDPTRLVNSASGWIDRGVGDVHDIHRYPGPAMPALENDRAVVLGEFGGLGLALPQHVWQADRNWGYRSYPDAEDLSNAYQKLVTKLHFLVGKGLSAAVYTQTTDVEIEVNGLLTYDREVLKLPKEIAQVNAKLYEPPPRLEALVETSQHEPRQWRYTVSRPAGSWHAIGYDDSSWMAGKAGFGAGHVPSVTPRTEWRGSSIWLRQEVEFPDKLMNRPLLKIYHDEDAAIYINGTKVASFSGYTTDYELYPIDEKFWNLLAPGTMTIAVRCQQTLGGQFIDVGIVDMVQP